MNRRQVFAAGVIGVTAAAVAKVPAQEGAKDNPELDKIKALLKAHDEALTNHNVEGVLATLAEGAAVMGSGPGEMWKGQEELKDAYQHFFMVFDKGEQHFEYLWRVGNLSSDMGWLMTSGNVTGKREGKEFTYPLNVSLTVSKSSGDWKIAAMHFSTLTGEKEA
ncbi:MAG: nuclear transport factor 2 family protein [Verrucomicrobiales bacterium]